MQAAEIELWSSTVSMLSENDRYVLYKVLESEFGTDELFPEDFDEEE